MTRPETVRPPAPLPRPRALDKQPLPQASGLGGLPRGLPRHLPPCPQLSRRACCVSRSVCDSAVAYLAGARGWTFREEEGAALGVTPRSPGPGCGGPGCGRWGGGAARTGNAPNRRARGGTRRRASGTRPRADAAAGGGRGPGAAGAARRGQAVRCPGAPPAAPPPPSPRPLPGRRRRRRRRRNRGPGRRGHGPRPHLSQRPRPGARAGGRRQGRLSAAPRDPRAHARHETMDSRTR